MTAEPTTDPATNRSRREMLCGLVVALLAPGALAAACGDPAPSGSGTATTGGAPTGGGTGGGGGAGGGALAALNDVPEGGGLIVDNPSGGSLLLVRPSAGEVKAFDPTCTHEGTQVSAPRNGVITCPNHGSQFDVSSGSVKRGPATAALRAVAVKVEGGSVVLA